MQGSRDDLKADLLSVLEAGRELSPANDEHLADLFLGRLEASRLMQPAERRPRFQPDAQTYGLLAVLGVLIVLPIVMIAQTYSDRDGYLPPIDPGAMPAVYWVALVVTLALLAGKALSQWTGWHVRILLHHAPR